MKKSNEALIDACFNNDSAAAIKAIDDNMAQIDTTVAGGAKKNLSNSTPIIIASARAQGSELVSVLLERGADITIRSTGYWYLSKESSTTTNKIDRGNALDVALFFGYVDIVKTLLLHAVLHLDSDEQSRLLERMPQKNVLLYVAANYPRYMSEMVKQILAQNDVALAQRIMCELASSPGATPKLIDKYLKLFDFKEDFDKRIQQLVDVQFDVHLNWFKALPSNKHANILIKDLDDAKLKFLLDGNQQSFNQSVLGAIQIALPTLGKQAAWKVAIGHFLEALAVILPISRKQIEFYKKTDAARQLEQMQAQLSEIPSAPLAKDETLYIPEAFVVGSNQKLEH